MVVVAVCFIYCMHEMYSFILPHYWVKGPRKNGNEEILRMRDALGSCVYEEIFGNQWAELCYTPHSYHYIRKQGTEGYMHPDDPRVI